MRLYLPSPHSSPPDPQEVAWLILLALPLGVILAPLVRLSLQGQSHGVHLAVAATVVAAYLAVLLEWAFCDPEE